MAILETACALSHGAEGVYAFAVLLLISLLFLWFSMEIMNYAVAWLSAFMLLLLSVQLWACYMPVGILMSGVAVFLLSVVTSRIHSVRKGNG